MQRGFFSIYRCKVPQKPVKKEVLLHTLQVYSRFGNNAAYAAESLNIPINTFKGRLYTAQKQYPDFLNSSNFAWTYPKIIRIKEPNSIWVIGSDAHFWPDDDSAIWNAFVKICKQLKPTGIVMNGDVIDAGRISRHPAINRHGPSVAQEIEYAVKMLKQLPSAKHRCWTIGNHDIRVDRFIANEAAELEGLVLTLKDKFPQWELAYAFEVNDVEIRHRFRGGIHAAWNNTLHSGVSLVSGHTHQLQLTAMRDRRGSRWGVETGMLSAPDFPQFEYTEGQPTRWQQGFCVLTFDDEGELYPPELCEMVNGKPIFRGKTVL